jgi:hypothetical protein
MHDVDNVLYSMRWCVCACVLRLQARLRDAEAAAELARTTAAQDVKAAADATAKLEADLQVKFSVICKCPTTQNMHGVHCEDSPVAHCDASAYTVIRSTVAISAQLLAPATMCTDRGQCLVLHTHHAVIPQCSTSSAL